MAVVKRRAVPRNVDNFMVNLVLICKLLLVQIWLTGGFCK